METLLVQDWMCTNVITINPELRVERAWELMERQQIRHVPVVKNARLVGIITERDLKRVLFPTPPPFPRRQEGKPQPTGSPGDLPVETIMTKKVYTAKPADTLLSAARVMLNKTIRSLPVLDATNTLVGMLTETDLLKALAAVLQKAESSQPSQ
jgi:acetoin utilization protein AcuB